MRPSDPATLCLASASPRRTALLSTLFGEDGFRVLHPNVDETPEPGERQAPDRMVVRLAERKALAVRGAMPPDGSWAIIAADTDVVLGDRILGKPATPAEARDMLALLSGKEHRVLTGVALLASRDGVVRMVSGISATRVRFAVLTDREMDWYVSTGEPLDKAGAYGVQGLGGMLVEIVDGSPDNVWGLPRRTLLDLIDRLEGEPEFAGVISSRLLWNRQGSPPQGGGDGRTGHDDLGNPHAPAAGIGTAL